MEYRYEIQLAGRTVKVEPDVWRQISDYVHSNQWFYVVHMGKTYKYNTSHSFFDRPAVYIFDLVTDVANQQIKYIFL